MKKKMTALFAAVAILLAVAVGGTIAYLTDRTETVENTFTVGDINIALTETAGVVAGKWQKQMVPGTTYGKDPMVKIVDEEDKLTNVDCWLFVEVKASEAAATYLTYELTLTGANGWTQGDGTDIPKNVWYREVKTGDSVKSWYLLEGDADNPNGCVTVNPETVTKATMAEAAEQTLSFTAYAAQRENLTVVQAWEVLNPKT